MNSLLGMGLGLISAIMTGSFSLPMKKTTRWSWEATWLIWSLCALLIIPWSIAIATVPNVFGVFAQSGISDLVWVFVFGLCWGLGAVLFGQSISMIGISLAFALCIGLATALGTLIPMLRNPDNFLTPAGLWATAGIAVMVMGVTVCAIAGHLKDKQIKSNQPAKTPSSDNRPSGRMLLGLAMASLGGIFSSMLNFAFNFSQSIKDAALQAGASLSSAADPVWALTLSGGLLTNVIYCMILLTKNKTWKDYRKSNTLSHWFLAALMGLIWMPSIALYGRAAVMMGPLGGSAGWGLYMGMVIVISNVWGFVTGEWSGVHKTPVYLDMAGVAMLLVAISLIGFSTTL